ncbi:hypothetical protein [Streptomyces sp. NPDC101165]|uniref:hypothetical protein n=1 Tax=Streptomyces sp. NPDC101165 TaxID=3366119 RepID=UPI0038280EA9
MPVEVCEVRVGLGPGAGWGSRVPAQARRRPSGAAASTVPAFIALGDAVRFALDPKLR